MGFLIQNHPPRPLQRECGHGLEEEKNLCVCGRFRTSLLTPAGAIAPVLHCSAQGEYLKTEVATYSYRHNPPYKLKFICEYGSRAMFFCGIYILLIGQLDNREI